MGKFFEKYVPEENSASLKRFLTLHSEELNEGHPNILEVFCQGLVRSLKCSMSENPNSSELFDDFCRDLDANSTPYSGCIFDPFLCI